MSSQFQVMPYTVTATMGDTLRNTSGAAFGNGMFFTKIHITSPTAADQFILEDASGNEIVNIVAATTDDIDINFVPPLPFFDFQCTTFGTSGAVMSIYCLM